MLNSTLLAVPYLSLTHSSCLSNASVHLGSNMRDILEEIAVKQNIKPSKEYGSPHILADVFDLCARLESQLYEMEAYLRESDCHGKFLLRYGIARRCPPDVLRYICAQPLCQGGDLWWSPGDCRSSLTVNRQLEAAGYDPAEAKKRIKPNKKQMPAGDKDYEQGRLKQVIKNRLDGLTDHATASTAHDDFSDTRTHGPVPVDVDTDVKMSLPDENSWSDEEIKAWLRHFLKGYELALQKDEKSFDKDDAICIPSDASQPTTGDEKSSSSDDDDDGNAGATESTNKKKTIHREDESQSEREVHGSDGDPEDPDVIADVSKSEDDKSSSSSSDQEDEITEEGDGSTVAAAPESQGLCGNKLICKFFVI